MMLTMVVVVLTVFALAQTLAAAVSLPAIFADHMVLQQERPVRMWGRAGLGERVTVELLDQSHSVTADAFGDWEVTLDPVAPRDGAIEIRVRGENELLLRDVLIGDVWLCGGQSNMEWPLARAHDGESAVADASVASIRLFLVEKRLAFRPMEDCRGTWVVCTPETAAQFSAVGYFFARRMESHLNRPIGLVGAYWGGTRVEGWTSPAALGAHPETADLVRTFEDRRDRFVELKRKYVDELLPAWEAADARHKQAGTGTAAGNTPPPHPYLLDPATPHQAVVLHYGMIAPLRSLGLRGAIWYQGESNDHRPAQYHRLFAALIADWRRQFRQPALPFLFVQLAGYRERVAGPSHHAWCLIREGQLRALELPGTAMVSAIDLGETYNIHPLNKRDVGERLARAARAVAYGEPVEWSGPLYAGMTPEPGGRLRIHFTHADSGLIAAIPAPQPSTSAPTPTTRLVGFTIAGDDRRFVRAEAAIDGAGVVVWSDEVSRPVAVRYAWASHPEVSLYNGDGLPASPFRSDDWPFE